MSVIQSTGVAKDEAYENQQTKRTPADYLGEELEKQRSRILRRAETSKTQREGPHHDFDDMTFLQDYQTNADAANTYLRKKRNKADVRINTATTEKKLDALLNELLSMNIQPEVRAHDMYDNEVRYLGKDIEDVVIRSNQIENEDDMLEDAYREMIGQRALFVKEVAVDKWVSNRRMPGGKYRIRRLEKRVVSGKKIYLGNINLPAYRFNDQPFYIEYQTIDWDTADAIFGQNPMFKHVQKGGKTNNTLEFTSKGYSEWRMNDVPDNQVEVFLYKSFIDGEYQVYVNGVPMEAVDAPLPWDWEGYDMTMITIKPISSEFAYGKPPVASAKPLQGLENETIRNLIYKMRQGLNPPIGVLGKKVFAKEIWDPGSVTQGVSNSMFSKLIDHEGVTQSEMAMFTQVNNITEEFIGVSRATQGLEGRKEKTATETLEQLRQSIKMMGLVIIAAMRLRRNVTLLRIYSILTFYSEPIGKKLDAAGEVVNKYMNFTLQNADLGDGRKGTRKIVFQDRMLTPKERQDLFNQEEELAKQGRPTRYRVINIKTLSQFPMMWYVAAVQKEKPGSAVDKLMNTEKINQVAGIEKLSMGQVKGNWVSIAEDVSASWGDRDLFQTTAPQQMFETPAQPMDPSQQNQLNKVAEGLQELEQSGTGAQYTEAVEGQMRTPDAATEALKQV